MELFGQSGMQFELNKLLQLQQKGPLYKQLHRISKKLVLVPVIFAPAIKTSHKDNVLVWIPYIYDSIQFNKSKIYVQILIDFGSKVNAMISEYALKLSLKVCSTNVRAQKINSSIFETFEIVLASFQVEDKLRKP